jgi:hypothetical protein
MKRPISHFLVPVFCLVMIPFCLQPGISLGADKTHGHAAGNFQLDIGNNDAGWVQSVEGGNASSDTVNEKLGPVPKQQTIAPARNVAPITQHAPVAKPLCPNPPCGLGSKREEPKDKKDSLAEQSEEQQTQMQEQMDRMQRADQTNSNTTKKFSDTQSGIIGNMK